MHPSSSLDLSRDLLVWKSFSNYIISLNAFLGLGYVKCHLSNTPRIRMYTCVFLCVTGRVGMHVHVFFSQSCCFPYTILLNSCLGYMHAEERYSTHLLAVHESSETFAFNRTKMHENCDARIACHFNACQRTKN